MAEHTPMESGWRLHHHAWTSIIRLHDHLFSIFRTEKFQKLVIKLSIAGFAADLILIFLARTLPQSLPILASVSHSYLSAIAVPFNFILFYEVLTLIAALPASTTRSMANQFEIVSLVYVRDVFRHMALVDHPNWIRLHNHQAILLLFDMLAGLSMFALVAIFTQIGAHQVRMPKTPELRRGLHRFIAQKKVVALGLTLLLLALAAIHLAQFAAAAWISLRTGAPMETASSGYFYSDLFTVMIFTDVLILILSLIVSGRYEMVFRNAAFVVAIILVRFSLTEGSPYGAITALIAMVFGILTLLIFNYHSRLRAAEAITTDH